MKTSGNFPVNYSTLAERPLGDWVAEQYSLSKIDGGYFTREVNDHYYIKSSEGYRHYDFFLKNFHFDGNSVTLFDFDFLGHGWLANDLMSLKRQIGLDVFFKRVTKEEGETLFSAFLESYRTIRPFNEIELYIIPYLKLGF